MAEDLAFFDTSIVFLEQAIRAQAMADAYLVALIGSRWYGATLPEMIVLPAVTAQQIASADESPSHDGHSGVERARFQITVWSECQMRLLQIAQRIAAPVVRGGPFDGFRGTLGGPGGIQCGRVAKVNSVDMGREPGRNAYQRVMDFLFWYQI